MKDLKKRNIVRAAFFFATLLLSVVAVAWEDGRTCSQASWRGDFGYTFTGTLNLSAPVGPVSFAGVGRETTDAEGNVSGFQNTSVGGKVSENTTKGKIKAGSDCTATMSVSIYNASGTTLLRTATWYFVLDNNLREIRAIMTSLALPDGTSVPATVTMIVTKQFPGKEE